MERDLGRATTSSTSSSRSCAATTRTTSSRASAVEMTIFDAGTLRSRRRHAGDLQRDRPRSGDRLRDGRRRAGRDLVRALDARPRGGERVRVRDLNDEHGAHGPELLRRREQDRVHVQLVLRGPTRTSRCSRAGGSRTATRRSTSGLPTKGTGKYEWRGFLQQGGTRTAITPHDGTIVNWNNKPAPGWQAADDKWSLRLGAPQRPARGRSRAGAAAHARLHRGGHELRGDAGPAHHHGAARDRRGAEDRQPAPSARAQQMLELLVDWRDAGVEPARRRPRRQDRPRRARRSWTTPGRRSPTP